MADGAERLGVKRFSVPEPRRAAKAAACMATRKIAEGLPELGECCGKHRGYRLMQADGLSSVQFEHQYFNRLESV